MIVERPLLEADIDEVVAMERTACAHPLHAWTEHSYLSSLRAGYWARVRCEVATGRIVAVCVAMDGVDEVHLLNIAVAREQHGRGHARALLAELVARCQQHLAAAIWLEVRPSNERARAVYLREGFVDVGVRKRYYLAATGREDAVVMRLTIALSSGSPDEAPYALD
jgi:ribosomal-protein-alanine N-acetyltransferase